MRWLKPYCGLAAMAACLALSSNGVKAADAPPFDRPGTAFNTGVFQAGRGSWEQGVPSYTYDRDADATTQAWLFDTRLRVGIGAGLEVQWAQDSWARQHNCMRGMRCTQASGGGDGSIAVKWAPSSKTASTQWAVLATHKLARGRTPLGGKGHAQQLAVSVSHMLGEHTSAGGSLARDWTAQGQGWLASANMQMQPAEHWTAYVEAVVGQGNDHARAMGAGAAWIATPRVQLDGWFQRGLDARTPDWQGGVGVSVAFGRFD